MKKWIALSLVVVMALCSFTAVAEEVKTYDADHTLQIAYIGWGFADETALFYVRNFDLIAERFNVKYTLSDAWGTSASADDVVEVLPSLIEAGAEAVIVHSMSSKIVEICNNAKVYFTLSGEVILDPELQALCDASPYYVGTIALADFDAGYEGVKYLAEVKGCKNIIYTRTSTRNLDENRLAGAKAACEEFGVTLLGEYCGTETAEAIRDLLASNPNCDGLFVGNGTNGQADIGGQTLESLGVSDKVSYVTICSPVGHEYYFENGTMDMIMSGEGFEPTICSMLLINAMRGNRVEETPPLIYDPYFPIDNVEAISAYSVYFSSESDELPLTADQLEQNWLKINNPELSNEWMANWIKNEYNIDSFNAAHGR